MTEAALDLLLVEDNPVDARFFMGLLAHSRPEWRVQHVDRLSLALQSLTAGGIDVVLLDLWLPDSEGLETSRQLSAQMPDVPVVVLTGRGDEAVGVEALRCGAQDYLVKGATDGTLLDRVLRYAFERKRAEAKRELLADLVDSASDAIVGADMEGRIASWNRGAQRIFGYATGEVEGCPLSMVEHPEGSAELAGLIEQIHRGDAVAAREIVGRGKDGQSIPLVLTVSPVWAAGGRKRLVGISAVAREVRPR